MSGSWSVVGRAIGVCLLAMPAVGCGAASESTSTSPNDSTTLPTVEASPDRMCPAGTYPILAAYALGDGAFKWVTCDPSPDLHMAIAADETDVWVEVPYPPQQIRVDAATGTIVEASSGTLQRSIPDGADRILRSPPATPAVSVRGGQDDPLVATDRATGSLRWRAVGFPVYDDVWAADDTAVYVMSWDTSGAQPGQWLVAYLIESGEERWRVDATDLGWPWHAAGGRLFSLWYDLHVLDAATGDELWSTSYGEPSGGFPRMFGAVANSDTVFVSFTSVGSGGD